MDTASQMRERIMAYFKGELSKEEEAFLYAWIKESAENKAFFFQLKNEFALQEDTDPLIERSYAELKSKLLLRQQFPSVPRKKKSSFLFLRVAAAIVVGLILGGGATYFFTSKPVEEVKVVWFETKVPRGEKSQLLLPDGSKVWMNSESSLSYPSNFMAGNRNVKLDGEAYFEVAKQQKSKFSVQTRDYTVRVLGTKFNVTGYADFNRTETALLEGSVEIIRGKQHLALHPGQTLQYKDGQFIMGEFSGGTSAKWKDNLFDFKEIPFEELVLRLERWYDVDIEVKSDDLNKIVYSGVFKNAETIEEILDIFQLTMPISYTKEDFRKFSIQRKKS